MELATLGVVSLVLTVVLAPLALEYADLRRSHGLGRTGALLTLGLLFPALGLGFAAGVALTARPTLQLTFTVAVTLIAYSAAAGGIIAAPRSAGSPGAGEVNRSLSG
jgi:hypothetical protein